MPRKKLTTPTETNLPTERPTVSEPTPPEVTEPINSSPKIRAGKAQRPKAEAQKSAPAKDASSKGTPKTKAEPKVKEESKAPEEPKAQEEPKPKTDPKKKSGKQARVEIPVTEVPEPPVEIEAIQAPIAPLAEAKGGGKGNRKGKKPVAKAAQEPTVDEAIAIPIALIEDSLLVGDEELPIPTWRPRQAPKSKPAPRGAKPVDVAPAPELSEAPTAADASAEQSERRPRRRRGKGGGDRQEQTSQPSTPKAVAPATEAEAEPEEQPEVLNVTFRRERVAPQAPTRVQVQIPEDAPQIVLREGIPTLVRNHKVYPPLMFFGSPADEKRAQTVLDELRMASDAGVHLHSFLIDFDVDLEQVDHAAAFAAYMLAKAVEIDPEAQIIFRVVFQAARGWQDKYPNARYRHADGSNAEPSLCDDDFWNVAKNCLERFVRQIRLLPLNEHILGLHLERGEWFFAEGLGYDNSKAAQAKFRDWARTRYNNDEVTLRASWFDGSARFDNIQVPEYLPEGSEDEKFIRSSRKQRRYVDYHLFLSDATVHRIGELAYSAKAASEGYFLLGASYGYTFEWSHPSSAHLSLGKLLRTPDIDFIAGPPSYREREPGGSAAFPCPIDSFALNGKLYISEEDFKTSLSVGHEPDDFNPTLKTPQALESAHWRGAGVALAHASGIAWMDLWGNGWLKTNSVWARAAHVREALTDRMQNPMTDPEVAIFIDERALAYLVDSHAFKLLVQNVRESVLRAGVSAAFYLLSDLAHREKFPESKLYVFLNAWDVRPDLRAAIKSRLQRDNKVLFWLYSAGMFDAGRDSLERAREVTGIALKPQPFYSKSGTTILNRRHPLSEAFPDRSLMGSAKLEPSYFAIPEGATVLGEYSQTGLPSFLVREFKDGPADTHWTSVFLGEPIVNAALIRALAQMAGAHVWNFHEDVVHVRAPFCTIHCSGAGPRTITLPNKYSAFNLQTNDWAVVDSTNLRFTAMDGSTHVFLVGPKDELAHFLNSNPADVLTMEHLPAREANVVGDISNFDVPIMKLDEWMEGGDSEEVAEDWFLRPQQIIEEPEGEDEGPDKIGRRRRKRRTPGRGSEDGGGARRAPSGSPEEPDFGDLGMNVMFRKRE